MALLVFDLKTDWILTVDFLAFSQKACTGTSKSKQNLKLTKRSYKTTTE